MNASLLSRATSAALTAVLCAVVLPGGTASSAVGRADVGRVCKSSFVHLSSATTPLIPDQNPLPVVDLKNQRMFVRFCQPAKKASSTVQVLIHGITYDHGYWNIADPDGSERYSWETAAAKAGYATLAIDRLGAGLSSHPPSIEVDLNSNVAMVKALVHALREGKVDAPPGSVTTKKVVLIGHSYGSITSWFAASNNPEVDAVVATGATHNIREIESFLVVATPLYPAIADPRYSGTALDPGYLVNRPGTKYGNFYAPDTNVDERVLAADEASTGTVTFSELNNYPAFFRVPLDIKVPVFLIIGTNDGIFCSLHPGDLGAPCGDAASLIASEGPKLGPNAKVDAYIVDGAGHALNAVRSSQETFAATMKWLKKNVPAK